MAILRVVDLGKTFTTIRGAPICALEGVNFELNQGELVSVIGPSGCGKSTILGMVAGLLQADCGQIYLYDKIVNSPHPSIAVVFQEDTVFPWRTAIRNVEFGLEMKGVQVRERRQRAKAMMELVGLSGFEDRYPGELSGGMKQRVAIARALVMEPAILLMDEPFGALDEQTRLLLGEELLRIKERLGQTILFITHNINEAVQISDKVVVMSCRPGKVKSIIDINLPRPRDSTTLALEQSRAYVAEVWGILREESIKSFRADSVTAR